MAQAERNDGHPARNPMLWIALIVVALVLFILFGGSRPGVQPAGSTPDAATDSPAQAAPAENAQQEETASAATVESPEEPGQEARDYIARLREQGPPWPFEALMQKASGYLNEGRLADAWLLYFFAAREGHPEAMMTLAEQADPNLFQAGSSLLDAPDPVQSWKWYRRALDAGFEPARARLDALRDWAAQAAPKGDREAGILMLNFR